MFAAYLYGCECWSTIDAVSEDILSLERKLLKNILQVKPSTPNALIYIELGRPDMIAKIKTRQKRFFENCKKLTKEEAIMRCILELCQGLEIVQYYEALEDGLHIQRLQAMKNEVEASSGTHCIRYNEISGLSCVDAIYNQFL